MQEVICRDRVSNDILIILTFLKMLPLTTCIFGSDLVAVDTLHRQALVWLVTSHAGLSTHLPCLHPWRETQRMPRARHPEAAQVDWNWLVGSSGLF